jgi:hypothetical protein
MFTNNLKSEVETSFLLVALCVVLCDHEGFLLKSFGYQSWVISLGFWVGFISIMRRRFEVKIR